MSKREPLSSDTLNEWASSQPPAAARRSNVPLCVTWATGSHGSETPIPSRAKQESTPGVTPTSHTYAHKHALPCKAAQRIHCLAVTTTVSYGYSGLKSDKSNAPRFIH